MPVSSKTVNMSFAREFAKRIFDNSKGKKDALIFLYTENQDGVIKYDVMEEWEYRHGYGQTIPENDVYASVFYGTGNHPGIAGYDPNCKDPPTFETEYF